jgi:hypothetical protein
MLFQMMLFSIHQKWQSNSECQDQRHFEEGVGCGLFQGTIPQLVCWGVVSKQETQQNKPHF